jgi:hypothetical protein
LHLAIQIVDRFMATTDEVVIRRVLQCVGVTSLFIACKYEEMFVPEIRDLTYICDGAYTESQVRRPVYFNLYIFGFVCFMFFLVFWVLPSLFHSRY